MVDQPLSKGLSRAAPDELFGPWSVFPRFVLVRPSTVNCLRHPAGARRPWAFGSMCSWVSPLEGAASGCRHVAVRCGEWHGSDIQRINRWPRASECSVAMRRLWASVRSAGPVAQLQARAYRRALRG
jgi:hypothetical protein